VERILIIKPSSLGDIVHGLLVAESIRQQRPEVSIDWVARDIFAPLVSACDAISRVHVFRRKGGLRSFGQLLAAIRSTRYDYTIDMQGLARSGVMTLASRTPRSRCLGRCDARELSGLACGKKALAADQGDESHAVDILRGFLPALGLRNELCGALSFSGASAPPIELPSDFALLFPGSRRAEKEWPGFPELTRLLRKSEPDMPVVWAGDREINAPSGDSMLINLTGRTALEALPSIIERAGVVVCNDSGPMHLAAALRRPVVGVFGPTAPGRFGPYPLQSPKNRVVCAPDGRLNALSPHEVKEAIDTIFSFSENL